jgi:CRISPR type I-E-associated protein CasB/Cse2
MPPEIGSRTASRRDAVGIMAAKLAREDYPPGDLAQLRRLDADRPDGRAFWQLVAAETPDAFTDERLARSLAITLRGMAMMREQLREGRGRPLGRALADAGVAEQRVLRLLRVDAERLDEELRQLARLLASKGDKGAFDWSDALELVLSAGWAHEDAVRRRIARDYYGQVFRIENSQKGQAA